MRLVDTSSWIEWLVDTRLSPVLDEQLPEADQWVVPTIVQLELAKWAYRSVPEDIADQILGFTGQCVVVPLTTSLALSAAEISKDHKLAVADAIIYATALATGADILTCDAHFAALPNVVYLPKA